MNNKNLCEIMKNCGSDKSTFHNYTKIYTELFKNLVNENINLFELGIGTNNTSFECNMGLNGKPGASLRGWKEFFPNSKIYSADIDKSILFQDNDISTFYCDQTCLLYTF
jgi:hypothetical protein